MPGHAGLEAYVKARRVGEAITIAGGSTFNYSDGFNREGTGDLVVLCPFDATTLGAGTVTVQIQHSDTDGSYATATDLTEADMEAEWDPATDGDMAKVRITGDSQLKKWVRVGLSRVGGANSTGDVVLLAMTPTHSASSDEPGAGKTATFAVFR